MRRLGLRSCWLPGGYERPEQRSGLRRERQAPGLALQRRPIIAGQAHWGLEILDSCRPASAPGRAGRRRRYSDWRSDQAQPGQSRGKKINGEEIDRVQSELTILLPYLHHGSQEGAARAAQPGGRAIRPVPRPVIDDPLVRLSGRPDLVSEAEIAAAIRYAWQNYAGAY